MTVRDEPTAKGEVIPRSRWRFVDGGTVALDGGFEPGRIYDVVYRAADPRVVGLGLSGTRDLVSFVKNDASDANPARGVRLAVGWGVSQSGRFLRHFLYQGFNEDEQGRRVSAGVERRRRHDGTRGAEPAELLAGRPRAVPRARSLGGGGRRAAAERDPAPRRRDADDAGARGLAGDSRLSAAAAAAARVSSQFRRRLGEGDRQRRAARGR